MYNADTTKGAMPPQRTTRKSRNQGENNIKIGLTSVVTDRAFSCWPLYSVIIFFTGFIGAKGDINEGISAVREKLWITWKNALYFWSFAAFICYALVPLFYRVAADVFFGTIFSVIYTYLFHKKEDEKS